MQLSFRQVALSLAHPWRIARSRGGRNSVLVVGVEVTDAAGLMGRGEASPSARYNESVETVERFLQQVDSRRLSFARVEESMRYIESLVPGEFSAKGALNVALLDGAAKSANKSLHDQLGLRFREQQHVTSFSIGIDSPVVIRKKVQAAERFPILKMKVGVEHDKENLAALREVAPTRRVRVDANEGWKTKEQALERIEWLAQDEHIEFVEQPMPADTHPHDLAWLKARSPLPIFADESFHAAADVSLCADCFHGVNAKLCKTGGVSGAFDALSAARRAGLKTMVGCMIESSVLISAAAHLAELCDFMDVDGNLLITNDPFDGVTVENGFLSFASTPEKFGLQVSPKIM